MPKFRIPRKKKKQLKKSMTPVGYAMMTACTRAAGAIHDLHKALYKLSTPCEGAEPIIIKKGCTLGPSVAPLNWDFGNVDIKRPPGDVVEYQVQS